MARRRAGRDAFGMDGSGGGEVEVRVAGALAGVLNAAWDACANPPERPYNPFVSHAFLSALEDSGCVGGRTGWTPRHLVVTLGGEVAAVAPAYLKSHSQGEYVFDYAWADAYERAGGRYYPKLQIASPFSPVPGPRLLVRPGAQAERALAALAGGIAAVVDQAGLSGAHVTFCTEEEWRRLGELGFLLRQDQQFHWRNEGYRSFDDFLAALASRKRKTIQRERREAAAPGITFERLTGAEVTEAHWDAFFAFYMDTGSRKWGRPYLNRRFFSLLGERLGERVLLVMAKRGGRTIAGALNLIGGDALYGRNWGAIEHHPFLHFEVCYYQAIEAAIERGLARVEAGAQGEHKLARGYLPTPTYSAHLIAHPGLRRAIAGYLEREREAVCEAMEVMTEYGPFRRAANRSDES
jgi:predicted N-acyltransferase